MAAAAVEVNAETDFVARNELFQAAVSEITALGIDAGDADALRQAKTSSGETVEDKLTNLIAKVGENMSLRRVSGLSVKSGVVASYVHNAAADGLGKIGVLVALESSGDKAVLKELGRKVAMHVAAGSPAVALAVDVDELSADVIEREKAVFADQARQSGKPEAIIEKMVEGRLRKFYEEVVLLKQVFVFDPDLTVEGAIEAAAKDAGAPVKLTGFVRMVLGEGVEKKEEDFAAEVAALGKS